MNDKINYLQDLNELRDDLISNGQIITGRTIIPGESIQLGPAYSYAYDSSAYATVANNGKIHWEVKKVDPKPVFKFPEIKKVIFNNNATVVFFDDDTKVIVKKSENDEYDKEHAIVYAIVKRLWGSINPDKTVSSNGFMQKLKRIVAAGNDQHSFDSKKSKNTKSTKKSRKSVK